jgi:hypothetical protein
MMRTFLDGTEAPEAGQTLAEALAYVGGRAEGRLVIEALADGAPVPREDLATPPDRAPYAGRLEFRTADAEQLVVESLVQAAASLDPIGEAQREVAGLIQSGQTSAAMDRLGWTLDAWARVVQAVELARAAPGVELPALDAGVTLDGLVASLTGRLHDIRRAIQGEDLSGLADALGYDMAESAERWRTALRTLAGGAGGG